MKNYFQFVFCSVLLCIYLSCGADELTFDCKDCSNSKDEITFRPNWSVGDVFKVESKLHLDFKSDNNSRWACMTTKTQKFIVESKSSEGFIVNWLATGFMINMFIDIPGPLFEWSDKLQATDTLLIKLKITPDGVLQDVENKDEIKTYCISILDRMIASFDVSDFKSFSRVEIKKKLIETKLLAEKSPKFSYIFINNLQLIFFPYGKKFMIDETQNKINYKTLPTLGFEVPVNTTAKIINEADESYRFNVSNKLQPVEQWRIKPKEFNVIDFTLSDVLEIVFDDKQTWISSAHYKYRFERGKYLIYKHLTFTSMGNYE